jgi:hypothetical protein
VTNPTDGKWNDDGNWFPFGVPNSNDDVILGGGITAGSYTVTLDVDSPALDSVTINSAGIGPATLESEHIPLASPATAWVPPTR